MLAPRTIAVFGLIGLLPTRALANPAPQTPPPAVPPASAAPGGPQAPREPAAEAAGPVTPRTDPASPGDARPDVDDEMLRPPARPRLVVQDWPQAAQLLKSRSTDLASALADAESAHATTRTALSKTLPSLNGTGAYTNNLRTNTFNQVLGLDTTQTPPQPITRVISTPQKNVLSGSLVASQPLLALPVWHQIRTARLGEAAAAKAVEATKRKIAMSAAEAALAVMTAERVSDLNRVGLKTALERLDLAKRRRDLGAATALDVVRAEQDAQKARATLVSGDETLRQSRESLGLVLGVPTQVGVAEGFRLDGIIAGPHAACHPVHDVTDRADVRAARTQVDVAKRNVQNVWLQYAPTLDARSTIQSTSQDTGVFPSTTWNVQGVLSWNILDGGARYARRKDAEAQTSKSEATLLKTERAARIEIARADRNVGVSLRARQVALKGRDLARESERLTTVAFREGNATSLELVTAAAALREAEITLALRDFDWIKARVTAAVARANCSF